MKPLDIANRYYEAFRKGGDFEDVPMAQGLRFRSPMMELGDAASFRGAVKGLAQQVKAVDVRHQVCAADSVLTVYDFDMGAPGGPIPMAEILTVANGELADVELLFDSARLRPPS